MWLVCNRRPFCILSKNLVRTKNITLIYQVPRSHPWRSSRRSCWELWSGRVHERGWCSSSYAGKPGTSLWRSMWNLLNRRTQYLEDIGHVMPMSQMVVHVKFSHGHLNSNNSGKTSQTTSMFNKKKKAMDTHVLLTLVTVEVAGDVDAFASHHHNFVSYKEKRKHEGVAKSYRVNDHRVRSSRLRW